MFTYNESYLSTRTVLPYRDGNVLLTVGHDAELFLVDRDGNGVPSFDLIAGSKEIPRPAKSGLGALLEDNVTAELNINPASCALDFVNNTLATLNDLRELLPPELQFAFVDNMSFLKERMDHPKAREFGCEPDYNFYTNRINHYKMKDLLKNNTRLAGGHVHLGAAWEVPEGKVNPLMESRDSAQALCLATEVLFGGYRQDKNPINTIRDMYYGRGGCFRPKPYGIEYRSLPNFWLSTPEHMQNIFLLGITAMGIALFEPEHVLENINGRVGNHTVMDAINAGELNYQHYTKLWGRIVWDKLAPPAPKPGKARPEKRG